MVSVRLRKFLAIGTALLFLMTIADSAVDNAKAGDMGWKAGEGWGYKWSLDFSQKKADIEKQMEFSAKNVSLQLGGEFSMMMYLRYIGKEGNSYRFEFRGGKYMTLNMSFGGEPLRTPGPRNFTGDGEILFSSYYTGYFLVQNESSEYCGISEITADISSDISFNIRERGTYANGTVRKYSEFENGNVRYTGLNLTFDPPVPFLPISSRNATENIESVLNYSAGREGHLSYYKEASRVSDNISQNLDGYISGKTRIKTYAHYNMNGTMSFPMPAAQMSEVSLLKSNGNGFDDIEAYGLLSPLNERYEGGFVSSMTVQVDDFPLQVTSQPATEKEVDSYLQDRWGHKAGAWDEGAYAIAVIGILASLAIIAVLAISVKKREKRAKKPPSREQEKDAEN